MKELVEALCSDECAGRAPGTAGGRAARRHVVDALREAGVDSSEREVPGCRGANVLATLPGDVDRWVMVAAHYDHLGVLGGKTYYGADDNAAAVAILVEVARGLAAKRADPLCQRRVRQPPLDITVPMGGECCRGEGGVKGPAKPGGRQREEAGDGLEAERQQSVPQLRFHQDAPDEGRSKRQGEGSHDTLIDD